MELNRTPALSELERLVLRLSAMGLLTCEVADGLNMTPDEVREHIRAAMAALGARSKLEAVVLGLGLIALPAD